MSRENSISLLFSASLIANSLIFDIMNIENKGFALARRLSIAFTTAQPAIQRLEQKRVVKRTTDARRNRVYCAHELLDILEEPAQLKTTSSV